MEVFVTGGSGFVGGHLVEALVAGGHAVRALARSDRSAAIVQGYGATAMRGDLGTLDADAIRGCTAFVHCAARVEEWGSRAQFWADNVDGTTLALTAARRAGVRRFVHVGTEAAVFDGHDLVDIDETHPYPNHQRYLYSETKAEAERRVLGADAPDFTAISIRPRLVWGPRDATVLPAIVRLAERGRFAWIDGGRARTSTAHVANVVAALVLALDHGVGGRAYFIADDGVRTHREFLTALARTRGVELPDASIPAWLARSIAGVVDPLWRALGVQGPPPVSSFAAAMMSCTVTVRTDRARSELGWSPILGVDEGLAALARASA